MSRHGSLFVLAAPRMYPAFAFTFSISVRHGTDPHGRGAAHRSRIGGTSGGVPNDELVQELKEVALEHVRVGNKISVEKKSTCMPNAI